MSNEDAGKRIGPLEFSKEDAHGRVAVLFMLEVDKKDVPTLIAVSVKWILTHGNPIHPTTGKPMVYHGTHIIQ